uniref:Uncharacterized protein n=1 Tax=Anguilla anguilla TaxID=7936 RepID=A0A0E9S2L0_ANGAN
MCFQPNVLKYKIQEDIVIQNTLMQALLPRAKYRREKNLALVSGTQKSQEHKSGLFQEGTEGPF